MKELFEYIESFSTNKKKNTDGGEPLPLSLRIILSIFICIIFVFGGTLVLGYILFGINLDASDEKGKQKVKLLEAVGVVLTIIASIYLVTAVINEYYEQEAKAKELQDAKKGSI